MKHGTRGMSSGRPKQSKAAISPAITAAAVILVALIVGGGAYYVGGSTVAPVTSTTTVTNLSTVTQTGSATTLTATSLSTVSLTSTITTAQTVTLTSTTTQTFAQFSPYVNAGVAAYNLLLGADKDKGFYQSNGLSPQWVTTPAINSGTYKSFIANGTVMGIGAGSDVLIARANGAPVKIIAGIGGISPSFIAVLSSSTIKTMADLNGQKIGLAGVSAPTATDRNIMYMANKSGIQTTPVYLGNANAALSAGQQLAALQAGTVAAIGTLDPLTYSMVATGQLRVIAYAKDLLPTPWVSGVLWATDSIIQSNPALVQAFVKATLQDVSYLSANPSYASNLYAQQAGVSPTLASAALALVGYSPSGKGSGTDLVAATNNVWQVGLAQGTIPAGTTLTVGSAVTTQFLGP
jgi:NitT/TauT family transport system substrate-binding protein